jgi:hypothetical protein
VASDEKAAYQGPLSLVQEMILPLKIMPITRRIRIVTFGGDNTGGTGYNDDSDDGL